MRAHVYDEGTNGNSGDRLSIGATSPFLFATIRPRRIITLPARFSSRPANTEGKRAPVIFATDDLSMLVERRSGALVFAVFIVTRVEIFFQLC